jgi:hypothetical protein
LAIDGIFVFGLNYLKVNVSDFPKTSVGFLVSAGFLAILMANLAILLKFWINWTFLDTLQYLSLLSIFLINFSYSNSIGSQLCFGSLKEELINWDNLILFN